MIWGHIVPEYMMPCGQFAVWGASRHLFKTVWRFCTHVHSMKTNGFPWSDELSNNFKSFIFGFSKEECVSVGPKIWIIKPGGVEEVSRYKDVFHKHHYDLQKEPEVDPDLSQQCVSVQSLQRVQDQVEAQDQGVTPVNLGECHKVLSVSKPPIVRVI